MKIEKGTFCPLIRDKCKGLECSWFIQIRGTDPNTGREIDEWECAVTWLPTLLINTANETRMGAAETNKFRNEMVEANRRNQEIMEESIKAQQQANEVNKYIWGSGHPNTVLLNYVGEDK